MAVHEFKAFAGASTANALTPSAYAALTALLADGFQPGVASSEQMNTVLRQSTVGVTGLAGFASALSGLDLPDDGNPATFAAVILAAVRAVAAEQISNVVPTWYVQAGQIAFFARTSPPLGWLKADGSTQLRASFPNLFAAIGGTWGLPSPTTFTLPNLQGIFVRGWNSGGGFDAGRGFGSLQMDSFAAHSHTLPVDVFGSNDVQSLTSTPNADEDPNGTATGTTGGSETRPINIALLACIRA